jgi:hypothetical protein
MQRKITISYWLNYPLIGEELEVLVWFFEHIQSKNNYRLLIKLPNVVHNPNDSSQRIISTSNCQTDYNYFWFCWIKNRNQKLLIWMMELWFANNISLLRNMVIEYHAIMSNTWHELLWWISIHEFHGLKSKFLIHKRQTNRCL